MFRLFFVVFHGKAKADLGGHPPKSRMIAYPLVILAVFSVVGGFLGIEQFLALYFAPGDEIPPFFAPLAPFQRAPMAAILGLAAFAAGIVSAYLLYAKAESDPLAVDFKGLSNLLRRKFYFDEMYAELIALTQESLATFANGLDSSLKLFIRGLHGSTELTGRALRLVQTGNLQTYALLFAAGIAVVLYFMLMR
jgi:NADH-quinone oxidoreductase subunit L